MVDYKGFFLHFISIWYPRICGIATFSEHTVKALSRHEEDILQINIHPIDKEELTYHYPIKSKHIIRQMDSSSWIYIAESIIRKHHQNEPKGVKTVVILEHEYGLDGNGKDNNYNEAARKLKTAGVPNIIVLHTILKNPNNYQLDVMHARITIKKCRQLGRKIAKSLTNLKT